MPFDPLALLRCKYGPSQPFFELGKKDEVLEKGMWRFGYSNVKEHDVNGFYDPPVTDSQVTLQAGGDSSKDIQGIGYRYMGMPMDEWRYKVLYRQNPTIKHIYDNWPISDEHPGMNFRNGVNSWFGPLSSHGNANPFFKYFTAKLLPGGRYYDAPEGEQCFTKAFSCARAMAVAMLPIWVHDCVGGTQPEGWRNVTYHYFRLSYLPVTACWMWGAVQCLLCSYRKQNDLINPLWASVAAGCVFGFRLGTFYGLKSGFIFGCVTLFWRVCQDAEVDNLWPTNRRWTTNLFEPTGYKWTKVDIKFGEIPQRDY